MSEYVPIEGLVRAMTKKAALIMVEREEVWVPFSVIHEDDLAEMEVGEEMEINVAKWFYEREIE